VVQLPPSAVFRALHLRVKGKENAMVDLFVYGLLLALIAGAAWGCVYLINFVNKKPWRKLPHQGVVKRDWIATGRIDFAATAEPDTDRPGEFKLLVEERRIVESIAGNENLEIQWRLATLREAKGVVTQYHAYLSERSLIRTITDEPTSLAPAMNGHGETSEARSDANLRSATVHSASQVAT
jgi:hypothetical protein